MDKILIEVFLPAGGRSYEVCVPRALKLHEVVALTAKMLSELSPGLYASGQDAVFCDRESGNIYSMNLTIEDLGLENGAQLMLI